MVNRDEVNKLLADPKSSDYGATSTKERTRQHSSPKTKQKGVVHYAYCVIYATVNVIIGAPGLYGYAAVIFNNPVFDGHMNALSKLVIFSSLMHQLGFTLFSTLDYAIGMVQDAGLIFLSHMANTIADRMVAEGHSKEEILSTTVVLLCCGTAALGAVLIVMGRFRLADAVAYLPMPVVGGYLAFIGYFCLQAGVALCISTPMMSLLDWKHIFDEGKLKLAVPGLVAGLVLTMTSRLAKNSGALPMVMVLIPSLFYLIVFSAGFSFDDLRSTGWVGAQAPSVPVSDLFRLVDFGQVRWDLIADILPTWVGMVFVVSFSSCLDVAAIGIDRGEALDTNKELATVGICNVMSGLTFGFTGSYIFSQTIFTYRTGVHDRTIGILFMFAFLYIVVSPVNVLEISPLFFLGSTLIFIGYDLMLEWLWEVRHQVFLTEYFIVCFTFCAIQVVGINFGVVIGVLVAIVEHIFSTAHNTVINKVEKRSNAVWTPSDLRVLNEAYNGSSPRIVTLEVVGPVFFGSALHLLNLITDEIGLDQSDADSNFSMSPGTPHSSSAILTKNPSFYMKSGKKPHIRPPSYLVLDLTGMANLDASAARGCFLQLAKMCARKKIMVCAAGATNKAEWILRSHDVSLVDAEEEHLVKERLLDPELQSDAKSSLEKILLFLTTQEALEFCETPIVQSSNNPKRSLSSSRLIGVEEQSISFVLGYILGATNEEQKVLSRLEDKRCHDKIFLKSNEKVFYKDTHPDAFYVVLSGCVARQTTSLIPPDPRSNRVLTGAGPVEQKHMSSATDIFDDKFMAEQHDSSFERGVPEVWRIGGIFGYLDYLMERQRIFQAAATQDETTVARITRSHMDLLQSEDPELHVLVQKALLHACTMDLANRP